MKIKVNEIKKILRELVDRELEDEYRYQINGGDEDKEYLAQLIKCKQWLIKGTSIPIVEQMIIKEDVENYLKESEE